MRGRERPVLLHVRRKGGVSRALQRIRLLLSGQRHLRRELLLRLFAILATAALLGGGPSEKSGQDSSPSTLADAAPDADELEAAALEAEPDQADAGSEADADSGLVILPAQFTEERMPMRMLGPGDSVDLWNAPQGGHVVLLGAKVKNLTSDTATLKVRFRRPDTGLIVAEEGRTVKMVPVPDEPGVMQPDIRSRSQVSNVPLCPSYGPVGIVDESFDMA